MCIFSLLKKKKENERDKFDIIDNLLQNVEIIANEIAQAERRALAEQAVEAIHAPVQTEMSCHRQALLQNV